MAPARNEPCSCGSGKKYKKCCAVQDTTFMAEWKREDMRPPEREPTDFERAMAAHAWVLFVNPERRLQVHNDPLEKGFQLDFLSKLTRPIADEDVYWARDVERARVHERFIASFHLRCSDEYDVTGDLIGTYADLDRENPHESGDWSSPLMRVFTKYLEEARDRDVLPTGWWPPIDDPGVLYEFCHRSFRNRTEPDVVEKMMLRELAADVLGTSVEPVVGGSWFDESETDESEYVSDESESEYESEYDESEDDRVEDAGEKPRVNESDPKTKTCETCGASEWKHDTGGKRSCFQCTGCKLVRYCSKECQKADWANHKARCKEARASLKAK
jgi:hypothetical protein